MWELPFFCALCYNMYIKFVALVRVEDIDSLTTEQPWGVKYER